MPLLAAKTTCDDRNPCRRFSARCPRCDAAEHLEPSDWYILEFYRKVDDQYVNQTPMGTAGDAPMVLTPRLEGYEAALRLWGYPRDIWPWLTHWTVAVHRLRHKMEKPMLTRERREHYRKLGVEGA